MNIGTAVSAIQQIMWQDAGVDGDAQRISQLVWMVFLKVFDDVEAERELLDDNYKSPVPTRLRWRTWAKDAEGITGEHLLDFVNNDLFKTLKDLPATGRTASTAAVVRGVFEDAFNYMKSGTLMRQVINKLNAINFNKASDRHEFGEIYETILGDLQSAGNAGEFYTPRAVTQFIVDMVDPKLGEKVLDPACGTGGFLTCAIERVRKNYVKSAKDEELLQQSIFGVEKKQLPHLLCVTNMLFHGIEVPSNIQHDNTLTRPLRDYGPKDRVDVVVTNPPFGGTEEEGIENNFPQAFRSRETSDLFLLLILTLLKPGGRAGIVLPDGTLFGEGVKSRIKERLLDECNLHTVVRLPKGVFSPYTSINTNLLFFEKGQPTKDIWFYEHPYPPGYKSYSKTKPLRIEEFLPEKKWWARRRENGQAWKVPMGEVRARGYNLDFVNPRASRDGPGDPEDLAKQYRAHKAAAQSASMGLLTALTSGPHGTAGSDAQPAYLQRVADNFEVLTKDAVALLPLRRAVLALAVRGSLVRREQHEGDAATLLRRLKVQALDGNENGPLDVPGHWQRVSVGAAADCVLGKMLDRSKHTRGTQRPYLRNINVRWSAFDLSDLRQMFFEDDELDRYGVRKGDVLICEGGEPGRSAVWSDSQPMLIQKALHRVRLREGIIPEWLVLNLRFDSWTGRLDGHFTGATIKHFTGKALEKYVIPLPPTGEQQRILSRVGHLLSLCDEVERRLTARDDVAAKLADALSMVAA